MFRKLKSVVVFLKIIISFVLTRPFEYFLLDCTTPWPGCNSYYIIAGLLGSGMSLQSPAILLTAALLWRLAFI